jgi:hypothetical protein
VSEPQEDRDVLGHLEKSARELIAAARDALDVADEVLSERLRLLGGFLESRTKPDPPTVERIDVDPG